MGAGGMGIVVEVVWVWKVEEWVGGGGSGHEWWSGWRRVGWVVEGEGAGWGRVDGRGGGCWGTNDLLQRRLVT